MRVCRLGWAKRLLRDAVLVIAAVAIVQGLQPQLRAQVADTNWEKTAGGKQEFEVASVREDKGGGRSYSNFSLDNGNAYFAISKNDALDPAGSLFSAKNQTLMRYIVFAYKLGGTQELALRFDAYRGIQLHVPGWVKDGRYDIEARAPGPATKDQMRLMMQSLLAERFHLAVHWETRDAPVLGLALDNPGKLGPQLKQHPARDTCATTVFPEASAKGAATGQPESTLPIPCGEIAHLPASVPGGRGFGGRNVTMAMLAESLPAQTGLVVIPRPVIDKTGLTGGFDFSVEWTPEDTSEIDNDETGGTFREALKSQLGLKLEPQKGQVAVLVIDHVERPTPN
jgi:uncharacterized protein (TIGR03435 family)